MEGYTGSRLEERIGRTAGIPELRLVREELLAGFPPPPALLFIGEWYGQLNRLHDQLIRRTLTLSERKLREEGKGSPPVPYAYVLVGSGGRSEQTQWSDQDNGLVYADPMEEEREAAERYFELLAEEVFRSLQAIGYPPCEGKVVCTNPQWRKPLAEWKRMLAGWFADPQWENVRYLLITADIRCVYGEEMLVSGIRDAFEEEVALRPASLGDLLRNTLHHKISLGPFHNLITERYGPDAGGLDVKYGAYIPMVNGIRQLAIECGIRPTASLERLDDLLEQERIDPETYRRWKEAMQFALWLRTQTPFQTEEGLISTRGILRPEQLTRELKQRIRRALRDGQELQAAVRKRTERLLAGGRNDRRDTP